jgi:hypothetical protein
VDFCGGDWRIFQGEGGVRNLLEPPMPMQGVSERLDHPALCDFSARALAHHMIGLRS